MKRIDAAKKRFRQRMENDGHILGRWYRGSLPYYYLVKCLKCRRIARISYDGFPPLEFFSIKPCEKEE